MNQKIEDNLNLIGNDIICPAVHIIRGGKILIGLRHYPESNLSVWTIPGGRCNNGERVGDALKREILEEIGITDLNLIDFLGKIDGAKEGDIVYLFVGTTNQEPRLLEPDKFLEWRWEDIDNIPKNFINPETLALIENFIQNQ